MDSGNSGSISSSGDEEYDSSRPDQTLLPPTFLNHHHTQFGSISSHPPQPSLVSSSHHHHHHHHPSLFDLSSSYLHALSQSQPNSNLLNLESRSTPNNCTDPPNLQGLSPSSTPPTGVNQCLLGPPHQGLATDPSSLQLRSVHDDNARVLSSQGNNNNAVRNSKKRTRASRRAPTTVLTTDTSNFRAMVQEFTGIPAPPFSGSSYSRRLDLLAGSSSLRSGGASHLDTTTSFYPLRPSPQKVHLHQNPLLIPSSSSSSHPPSTLLHSNMVDALASTTNVTSSATANNNASSSNSINYQLPPDLGLPYHQQQNIMLSMQNHPILAFHPPPPPLHLPAGFSAKSQIPMSLDDLGMSHGHVNAHNFVGSGGVQTGHHGHVTSEGMPLRINATSDDDGCRDGGEGGGGGRRDPLRSLDGGYGNKVASAAAGGSCKLNFSASASSGLNHEKALENTSTRGGEGAVDSWICSSD